MEKIKKQIIRTAIYIRVSTEEQVRHGYSLNSQKERLTDYCKNNNYKIIEIYADEGKSARSKLHNRKELMRLVSDAKEKKFDRIVFWRLDRWFRNIADYYKIQEILENNNIDWECSDEEFNTTTSNGRLHLNIKLSIAQNESDQTSDRIKFNFDNMIKNKRAIQGSHCMPIGYIVAGEEKNKHVIKDESNKEIVEDMFEHFATYNSIRKTVLYINKKYNKHICYDSLRHYIKNELYCGKYKGVEDYCEPYITKEEYLLNQQRIKRNIKDNNRKHDYIFSGLLKCYSCGYSLTGGKKITTKPKYNKRYECYGYTCNRAHNTKLCSNWSPIIEHHLEKYLLTNLNDILKAHITEVEKIEEKKKTEKINVNNIKAKIERLADLYIDGRISKEKYEEDYKKLNDEIEQFNTTNQKEIDLSLYKSLLNGDGLLLYDKLDNISKRAFWSKYIDYISRDKELNYIVKFK